MHWSQPTLKPFRRACVEAGLIFGAWAWTATSFVAVVAALDHCLNVTYVQSASLCDIDMLWVRGHPKTTLKGKSLINWWQFNFYFDKKGLLTPFSFSFWGQVDFFFKFWFGFCLETFQLLCSIVSNLKISQNNMI